MYPPVLAAALSGASVSQLEHWRREPVVLRPEREIHGRYLYSFRDVVALRTISWLRERDGKSLQQIRKALGTLSNLGKVEHLSTYTLVSVGNTIALYDQGEAIDLVKKPGNQLIAQMIDVLAPFKGRVGEVVPFERPAPGVLVDPEVRAGYPVIEGTRVGYDQVTGLLEDGISPDEIAEFFPKVSADQAKGARQFARYVEHYKPGGSVERAAG